MAKRERIAFTNEIWSKGSYLSTRVYPQMVIHTYVYEDDLIDIEYSVETGMVTAVHVEDVTDLRPGRLLHLEGFKLNPN